MITITVRASSDLGQSVMRFISYTISAETGHRGQKHIQIPTQSGYSADWSYLRPAVFSDVKFVHQLNDQNCHVPGPVPTPSICRARAARAADWSRLSADQTRL